MDLGLVIVLAVIGIAVVAAIAPRVGVAGPLVLLAAGVLISFLPFVPPVDVQPEWILAGVLPPLLYSAAVSVPAMEFRRDFSVISGLSVVLVVVTSVVLGVFFAWAIPGLGLALGIALGAILSPTDAVATSIVKRLGISPRVVAVLEGESLLNDATALVLLRTAIAAVAGSFSLWGAVGQFAWTVVVAVLIGAAVGIINLRVRAWIAHPTANTALSFTIPFVASIPAELVGGSGLVAAVVAGIITGQGAARWFTPQQRISDRLNWRTIELVLEGGVFLLMGLELHAVLEQAQAADDGIWRAIRLSGIAVLIILLIRTAYVALLVFTRNRGHARRPQRAQLDGMGERLDAAASRYATQYPSSGTDSRPAKRLRFLRLRLTRSVADLEYYESQPLRWRESSILVWAGMRGAVTLAAAQTLEHDTDERALLVLVAFIVAAGTLLIQGATLGWLARRLGLADEREPVATAEERASLGAELRDAALTALGSERLQRPDGSSFDPVLLAKVTERVSRIADPEAPIDTQEGLQLRIAIIEAQRRQLVSARRDGRYSSALLRQELEALDADQVSIELRTDTED